jgi:Flp pilus assembly protein TadG
MSPQGPGVPLFYAFPRPAWRRLARPAEGRGAASLEMALGLPVFLLLIFGLVEFGLVLYVKGMITAASREGVRYGAVYSLPPRTQSDIEAHVQNYLHGLGVTGAVVTVPSPPSGVSEDPVRVTVSYTYHSLVLSQLTPSWAGTLNLSAETVMLLE